MEQEVTHNRSRYWLAGIAGVICISLVTAACITLSFSNKDQICRGVTIEGTKVGGLTKQQCTDKIADWASIRANKRIILTALDTRWAGKLPDFGARIEWKKAVDQAYAVGREGNFLNRMVCVLTPKGNGKQVKVAVLVDKSVVRKTIRKVARAINRPHVDARLRNANGILEITQDSIGIKLNKDRAVASVVNALKLNQLVAELPVNADTPDVTAKDAAGIDTLIARYTTPFNPGKRDRTHNLRLASTAISGVIIKPGMEFSYNDSVGPRVEARGFREAPIFVKGKMEPGVGGGICQVSSTLYNAVLMTGLHVVERHPHSRTVPYVTAGRDATVAYGIRDFRFNNPQKTAVGILTRLGTSHLTVDIYGAADDKKNICIFTGPVTYTGTAGTITVFDPTLPPGARKVVDKGSRGARVTVYRKIIAPDGTCVTERISRDRYPPQSIIIGVGPARVVSAATASARN